MSFIRVEPLSADEAALEALDNTLSMLPMGGGKLLRFDGGEDAGKITVFADGSVVISCAYTRFIRFAVVNQGYVKRVIAEGAQ